MTTTPVSTEPGCTHPECKLSHPHSGPAIFSYSGMTELERIESKLDAVLAISQRVETLASKVADQVKPVLDDLMKSPLLKMLGVKAK